MYLLNSPAYKAARYVDQEAHAAIRRLLDGCDPAALPPPGAGSYGRWTSTLDRLFAAHAEGGRPAVEAAYQELYRADDRLIALMGSGGNPPGVLANGNLPSIVTLEDLLAAQIPPIEFFIEQILCVGVTNLSGRPKVGKSWLAADMALALSTGGKVLGFKARLVKVLYLALEDSAGRIQDRFRKLQAQANRKLHVALGWRALNDGGLEDIDTAVVREGYQVVFIDTFSRVNGRADQMDPNEMTQIYAALQQLALRHGIAIVVVDHHRKSARNVAESDPIDDIFGSTAKASVVDCAIGLYRKHNSPDAILKLVGRDFGDAEYALTWDAETFTWHRNEDGKQAHATPKASPPSIRDRKHVGEILEALDALGPASLAALAAIVKVDKRNLLDLLLAMVEADLIRRSTAGGSVTYAPIPPAPATECVTQPALDLPSVPDAAPATSSAQDTAHTTHTTRTTDTTHTTHSTHTNSSTTPHVKRPKPPPRPKRKKR